MSDYHVDNDDEGGGGGGGAGAAGGGKNNEGYVVDLDSAEGKHISLIILDILSTN